MVTIDPNVLGSALVRIMGAWFTPVLWRSVKEFGAAFGYARLAAVDYARVVNDPAEAVLHSDPPDKSPQT